jgi:hypothetical protein
MKKNTGNSKPAGTVVPFPRERARSAPPPQAPSTDKRSAVARSGASQRLRAHRPGARS